MAEAEDLKSSQCGFDPHSGHKFDRSKGFHKLKKILFIGDSLIAHGDWQSYLLQFDVENIGTSGDSTEETTEKLDQIIKSGADLIVAEVGINDFGSKKYSKARVASNIFGLAEAIRTSLPSVSIVWNSLTPRSDDLFEVEEVNESIQKRLANLDIIFFDVFSYLKNKSNNRLRPEFISDPDGFANHLNDLGYEAWITPLKPLIIKELNR